MELGRLGGKKTGQRRTAQERREFARMGGQAGGKARAAKLTAEQRSEAARKASRERWRKYREAQAAEERGRLRGMEETEAVGGQG